MDQDLRSSILNSLLESDKSATQLSKALNVVKSKVTAMLTKLHYELIVEFKGGHKWGLTTAAREGMQTAYAALIASHLI